MPRNYHHFKTPLLTTLFFTLGSGMSIAHCVLYSKLDNTAVGSPAEQENNLRQLVRLGTAFAFLSQICLAASVWQTYTQWIWRSVRKTPMTIQDLNDIFNADLSVLSFLNLNIWSNFTVGSLIALFGWSLLLPSFFTPGTLVVNPSTQTRQVDQLVPYLSIGNSTEGHYYSYSPSNRGDTYGSKEIPTRIFSGPRTILTRLSTATSSKGEILSLKRPYNHSSYSQTFFGPAIQCLKASSLVESQIDAALADKMSKPVGNAIENINAYYGFVPSFDSNGTLIPLAEARYQSPAIASNELWQVFQRYIDTTTNSTCDYKPYYQVCSLWNATYNINLEWDSSSQSITGTRDLLHRVEYPNDPKQDEVSNMAQHAYSAFFWVLANQAIGSFGWFNETVSPNKTVSIMMIASPIQHNSLLGTSDLDVFFDFNEAKEACQTPYMNLTAQRQQDKDLARSRRLNELIEEMGFNMTVSLMHNDLLTGNNTRLVTVVEDINRYGTNRAGLFIPYALACALTLLTVFLGIATNIEYGVLPDKKFQDILAAADDSFAIKLARSDDPFSRKMSIGLDPNAAYPSLRVWGGSTEWLGKTLGTSKKKTPAVLGVI
ncbi:hypothetical protein B0H63DRAFT_398759 [Podospora didyma]|uniref:Uncharacterized protein n=1 Tax=Podospora didyma TaxID=330526 RepID=A0AAE0KJM9_9PEZI|nr:hypothetical protein B0H63DRAFT_398759 [Podospora didyma]